MKNPLLREAIRRELRRYGVVGASIVLGGVAASVAAQDASTNNQDQTSQKLETITVTGSNIRRVDIETSNPVITVDRAAIARSGKVTVGDLVQELPTIAGNMNNPNVNNGGGTGGSFVSLRGLGSNRTLILVDGKRVTNIDVNGIPAAAIERIEVLTDGASAVYGSDAIAGVVNFILRKEYQGAELQTSYGISDHDDGVRKNFSLTFGQTSDKGSLVGGIDYNKTDQILASHRDFSTYQLTKQPSGNVVHGGSIAAPSGFISAPQFANCPPDPANKLPGGAGTFDPTAPGGDGIPAGYRCFKASDKYNYASINLITTPQERSNFFLLGNYKLTDSIEAYASIRQNKTRSRAQFAPLPVDIFSAGLVISKDNPYNPFGVDVGFVGDGANDLAVRLSALGPRIIDFTGINDQAVVGLKGNLLDTSWQYDLWYNYGYSTSRFQNINYLNASAAQAQLGANCDLPVPGQPVTANTCLNIWDQTDPGTQAVLRQDALTVFSNNRQIEKQGGLDVNGTLFDLPAGSVSLAVGANYRKFNTVNNADTVAITAPGTSNCPAGTPSLCTSPFSGGFNVKEAYGEMFVPVLKDLPLIHSLSVTLGDRYSKYSSFGSTNNWKAAVEYRPIEDLLLRGTVSTVFRAPNTAELFTALVSSFDNYVPPGLVDSLGRSFISKNTDQVQVLFSGAAVAGIPIKPEQGKSFDFGAVYDPQWISGLSMSADVWRIYLQDLIVRPTGQTIANFCFNDPTSSYCDFINFGGQGIINMSGVGFVNLGRLDTKGVDFSGNYKLPETAFGNFNVGLQATYLAQYDNNVPGAGITHVAGLFNSQFGNLPRWRALGNLSWQMGDFSASWRQVYHGAVTAPVSGRIGAVVYNNVSAGYNIAPINMRIDVGIDNVGDKQPPYFYQDTTNANIDINTYDPIGRFYFARATLKF